jgi:hypothetical protein
MTDATVTFGQLERLLMGLSFESVPGQGPWKIFRHVPSGTTILLADRRLDLPARMPDVVSIRRHLADNGILGEDEFDRCIVSAA